jgi:hypothetical protein
MMHKYFNAETRRRRDAEKNFFIEKKTILYFIDHFSAPLRLCVSAFKNVLRRGSVCHVDI